MPAVITTTIGTNTVNVTVNSVSTNGAYGWDLVCSASVDSSVKVGDKVEYPTGGSVFYRVVGISAERITVRKYFGQKYTGQADPSGSGSAQVTRAFATPNGTGMWNGSAPANLTTESVEGETGVIWKGVVCYDSSSRISVTASITLNGSTSSTTCYKWLTAADGESWRDLLSTSPLGGSIAGAGFLANANTTIRFSVAENYGVIENLTLVGQTAYSTGSANISSTGGVIRNCYIRSRNTVAASTAIVEVAATNAVFMNNFVVMDGSATTDIAVTLAPPSTGTGNRVYVLANTFVRPSDAASGCTAIRRASSNSTYYATMIGNAFFGFGTFWANVSGPTIDECTNNATDFTAGSTDYTDRFPGTNHKYSADISGSWSTANNVFVNTEIATLDLRAVSSGVLAGNSTQITSPLNPSGSGGATQYLGTGDFDALGSARSTSAPYIGAYEGASVVSSPPPFSRMARISVGVSPIFYYNRSFT